MSKIICNICGREEDPERWIPETAQKIKNLGICFECLHWRTQTTLDDTERGLHGWAVINGMHYVLAPHTDVNWPRGMGGAKMKIRFFDGYETECDNLWCQGEVPEGYWRDLLPDNAEFITENKEDKI